MHGLPLEHLQQHDAGKGEHDEQNARTSWHDPTKSDAGSGSMVDARTSAGTLGAGS